MLRKRLIASFFMITPVLAIMYLDAEYNFGYPGLYLIPMGVLCSIVVAGELTAMLAQHQVGLIRSVAHAGAALCASAVIMPHVSWVPVDWGYWDWSCLAIGLTLAAAFIHELACYQPGRAATVRLAVTMLVALYPGWLISFLVATRLTLANDRLGVFAIFTILWIVKISDAGAYFVGKQFGRNKLAPVLSPGKTIEGLMGGLAAAMLASWVAFRWLAPWWLNAGTDAEAATELASASAGLVPVWAALGYGLTLSAMGVLGDLSESLIKRDMQCKDSSGWLPGLGGIMDTADSVLFAAPAAFLWWASGILG